MKRILLLLATIFLSGSLAAQENYWNVFLRGQAVKAIDFENDYVWVVTDSLLISLNKQDNNISHYHLPEISENTQTFLKVDNNGVKWIVQSNLKMNIILGFDGNNWDKIEFNGTGPVTSLAVDKNNDKWITAIDGVSFGQLLYTHLYKLEQDSFIQYSPENSGLLYDYVSQVTSDRTGNIWLGNYGELTLLTGTGATDNALVKYDGYNWNSCISEKLLIFYKAICVDNLGDPWVQVLYQGVRKLNTASNIWSDLIVPKLSYYLLAVDGENRCWFNNWSDQKGVAIYNGSDWNYYTTLNSELPSDKVYQIAIDSHGTKWIGTGNGLATFKEGELNPSVGMDNFNPSYGSITISASGITDTTNASVGIDILNPSNGIDTRIKSEIELFPNPANDHIILRIPCELQNPTVDIINSQGKFLTSFSCHGTQNRLDVSHFPAGVYFVRIQTDTNFVLHKFVKQ